MLGARVESTDRGVELGVLLEYIPAETHYVGFDAPEQSRRVAVVAVYPALASAPPRRVAVPARYREVERAIHARGGIERALDDEAEALPERDSQLSVRFEERRALLADPRPISRCGSRGSRFARAGPAPGRAGDAGSGALRGLGRSGHAGAAWSGIH